MGLVDPHRASAASLLPVPYTGAATWASAAPLRPVLAEGGSLPAAHALGGVELLLEVFAAVLPPVPVAGGARQVVDRFGVRPLEFLNALVPRILLWPRRPRTAASAALASHAPRIGTCPPNLHTTSRIFSLLPWKWQPEKGPLWPLEKGTPGLTLSVHQSSFRKAPRTGAATTGKPAVSAGADSNPEAAVPVRRAIPNPAVRRVA